jgi:tetratricopeptide (TPR) repeat protein
VCNQLTPHLLVQRELGGSDVSAALYCRLLTQAGNYFFGRGAYYQAAELLREVLAICEQAFGPEHFRTAISLNHLAKLLREQGDLPGARALLERALAIWEQAIGPGPETATCLNSLANLLRDQGDLAGARALLRRALAMREMSLGPEHPDTATSLKDIANLLLKQGDLASAWRLAATQVSVTCRYQISRVMVPLEFREYLDTAKNNLLTSMATAQMNLQNQPVTLVLTRAPDDGTFKLTLVPNPQQPKT